MTVHPEDPRVVLACDTSTRLGSVALLESGVVTGEVVFHLMTHPPTPSGGRGTTRDHHSRRVLEEVARLLERRRLSVRDIGLFVASLGPGSFTGVRTTLATLKGLAWAVGRPLAGVCSLRALAWPLFGRGVPVLAALDARRGEVYAALYGPDGSSLLEPRPGSAEAVAEAASPLCRGEVLGVGEGVVACRERFEAALGGRFVPAEGPFHVVRASVLAHLGMRSEPIPVDRVEPLYLRRPEAEARRDGTA